MKRRLASVAVAATLLLGGHGVALADDTGEAQSGGGDIEVSTVSEQEATDPLEGDAGEPPAEDPAPADEGEDKAKDEDRETEGDGKDDEGEPTPFLVEEVTAEILDPIRTGCEVTISVKTTGDAEFRLDVSDDGEVIDSFTWEATGTMTHEVVWTITRPASSAVPGVGFEVFDTSDDSKGLDFFDPFEYPADVADQCAAKAEVELSGYDAAAGILRGEEVQAHGTGFQADEAVVVTLWGTTITSFQADGEGSFVDWVKIPVDAKLGAGTLTFTGADSGRSATAGIKVVAPAEEITGQVLKPSRDRCKVTIPVKTTGAATFELRVWDDGEVLDTFTWKATKAQTHVVTWMITRPARTDVPGVGFVVYDATTGAQLDSLDPYTYPASVAYNCSAAQSVTLELPGLGGKAVAPGAKVQAAGSGYLAGETVYLYLGGSKKPVGTFVADSDGSFSGTFVVPRTTSAGDYVLTSRGKESGRSATVTLKVYVPGSAVPASAPKAGADEGELAKTGAESVGGMVILGIGLLAAGVGLTALNRRRLTR